MPGLRSLKRTQSSGSNSSSSSLEIARAPRQSGIFNGLKINIIDIKLTPHIVGVLTDLAEERGARMVAHPDDADIVVTEIGTRARLERHITWEAALNRVVVEPGWLEKSAKANEMLPFDKYLAIPSLKSQAALPTAKAEPTPTSLPSGSRHTPIELSDTEDDVVPIMPRYCVQRKTPLICPNQELVAQFAVIKKARWLDKNEISSLAYARAIAAIKAYPKKIRTIAEIEKQPYIGPTAILKPSHEISQYLSCGMIEETRTLTNDPYYKTLSLFTSLYGVGPDTAQTLYTMGMRSMEDLEAYYTSQLKTTKNKASVEGMLHSLALRDELNLKIARAEVEEVSRLVCEELSVILPGFIHTITGGYRRGKPESNDIDIVFSHPQSGTGKDAMGVLINRLRRRGLITHVLPATSFRSTGTPKAYGVDEALERVLSVFVLPQDSPSFPYNPAGGPRKHRRLDLIFAPIEVYWCAVIGWSGSILFQRDLRSFCKDKKQYKFDSSGLTRRRDAARIAVKSEKHLFQVVGLPYIDPIYRNCDF